MTAGMEDGSVVGASCLQSFQAPATQAPQPTQLYCMAPCRLTPSLGCLTSEAHMAFWGARLDGDVQGLLLADQLDVLALLALLALILLVHARPHLQKQSMSLPRS